MKSKCKWNYVGIVIVAMLMMVWSSCKVEKVTPITEPNKQLSGSWKVLKATRNGTDLTAGYDFTKFRIKFEGSNYTLTDELPFLVYENGSFGLDDPQYPFKITFTPTGGSAASTAFNYPTVDGKRRLELNFSSGCTQTTYVYTLVEAE
ncbi:DUF5004 domain-containing protein [Mucilaginibacter hurinus]|uniref:DUF5004 domain-containing protein n=1 Tax=Mucilaginibacter hurinus TaxID=2201324 RepID=A0A367GPG3_9SPHI|nr:DUF5004 domain-containing protein [Mucilaginibacter hurinus]RCH55190.1 DUF5004 domain-containing protein [Mucilaginibacter hurinus]